LSLRFAKGQYKLKNPDKYIGAGQPTYRSSWELAVMRMCDNNPSIQQWASESIKIPYRDPLTGKQTVYVPDFLVVFIDKNMNKHAELWEIKPANQQIKEKVGKNPFNQAQYVKNMAKWQVATQWAKSKGLKFRVLNETDIFHQGAQKR
jgi:hypothetical protein